MSAHRSIVNTIDGDMAELYCEYDSGALGSNITWRKDGNIIHADHERRVGSKFIITEAPKRADGQNTSILCIQKVAKNDLGLYECTVQNAIGAESVKIELTLVPEPPHLHNLEQDDDTVTTHWIIKSLQPLTEVTLNYQQKGVNSNYFLNSKSFLTNVFINYVLVIFPQTKDWITEKPIGHEKSKEHGYLWK